MMTNRSFLHSIKDGWVDMLTLPTRASANVDLEVEALSK